MPPKAMCCPRKQLCGAANCKGVSPAQQQNEWIVCRGENNISSSKNSMKPLVIRDTGNALGKCSFTTSSEMVVLELLLLDVVCVMFLFVD